MLNVVLLKTTIYPHTQIYCIYKYINHLVNQYLTRPQSLSQIIKIIIILNCSFANSNTFSD